MTDIYVYDCDGKERIPLKDVTFYRVGAHLLSIRGTTKVGTTIHITNGCLRTE